MAMVMLVDHIDKRWMAGT